MVFRYGAASTLRSIHLVIRRGQSVGIVGPSGSGKTTLLDLVTGLQPRNLDCVPCCELAIIKGLLHRWGKLNQSEALIFM